MYRIHGGLPIRIGIIIILFTAAVFPQTNYSSTPFSSYLMLPLSAEDEALGQAFPQFWNNPAAMFDDDAVKIETGYRYRWGDASDDFLSISMKMRGYSAFALLQLASVADIEGRTHATTEPEYMFSANRANLMLGGAFQFQKYLRIGIAGRHIHEHLELYQLDANTVSAGMLLSWRSLNGGIAIIDYGGKDKFDEFLYPAPTVYRASLKYLSKYFGVSAAFIKPDIIDGYGSMAAYAEPLKWAAIMASYTIAHDTRSIAFGADFAWHGFSLCYAIAFYGELGTNHAVSLAYRIPLKNTDENGERKNEDDRED